MKKVYKNFVRSFFLWRNKLISSPSFQNSINKVPLLRLVANKDGEKIYDLVAGFVYSQTLLAMVELGVLDRFAQKELSCEELSKELSLLPDKVRILCQSAAAIGLLVSVGNNRYRLSRLGAATIGVPGLKDMIRHHKLFYQDLVDPVKLLQGNFETKMSEYWPYVLKKNAAEKIGSDAAKIYSELMASSQVLVARETLRVVSFKGITHLLDVGGGTGMFIKKVAEMYSNMELSLFDLPSVVSDVRIEISNKEKKNVNIISGNFVEDELPAEANAISLIRILYDHDDSVVKDLLKKVYDVLPRKGVLIISEPMSGGKDPRKAGDSYFGFYTMAMSTGKPRDFNQHSELLLGAGFKNIKRLKGTRDFITSVIVAKKGK